MPPLTSDVDSSFVRAVVLNLEFAVSHRDDSDVHVNGHVVGLSLIFDDLLLTKRLFPGVAHARARINVTSCPNVPSVCHSHNYSPFMVLMLKVPPYIIPYLHKILNSFYLSLIFFLLSFYFYIVFNF